MNTREQIIKFLECLKSDFLEKKINQDTREKKKKYEILLSEEKMGTSDQNQIIKEKQRYDESVLKAREKHSPEADNKYDLKNWFDAVINKVKPNVTTHPAKFTDPNINGVSNILFYGQYDNDGYVKTGNTKLTTKVDVSGNSATNTLVFEFYSLLAQNIGESKIIINSFESDEKDLVLFFEELKINYELIKNKCLEVFFGLKTEQVSHESIRQIYFPTMLGNYHLLSVLTPSMLMFEVKNRIDLLDKWENGKHVRTFKKDNKLYEEGFDEVLGLTEIGFSHTEFTKMGNVSYLNVKNKGISYLLRSTPPELVVRNIRLPSTSFLGGTIREKKFDSEFQALLQLSKRVNNFEIRQKINDVLSYIIEQILDIALRLRMHYGVGWSNAETYQNLPLFQKIWLDDQYEKRRSEESEWFDELSHYMARWIIKVYEHASKKASIKLGDAEFNEIKDIINEFTRRQDKEFF